MREDMHPGTVNYRMRTFSQSLILSFCFFFPGACFKDINLLKYETIVQLLEECDIHSFTLDFLDYILGVHCHIDESLLLIRAFLVLIETIIIVECYPGEACSFFLHHNQHKTEKKRIISLVDKLIDVSAIIVNN